MSTPPINAPAEARELAQLPKLSATTRPRERLSTVESRAFVGMLRSLLPIERDTIERTSGAEGGFTERKKDSASEASRKRATLAALRRGLGKAPGEAPEMFPYVIPYLPKRVTQMRAEAPDEGRALIRAQEPFFLIASLFAAHQLDWPYLKDHHRNFGASYRALSVATGRESVEQRFIALLSARRDDLPTHLRHAIGQMKAHDVPVRWSELLDHVLLWDEDNRRVQVWWANSFWAPVDSPAAALTADQPAPAQEGDDTPGA